MQRIKKTKTKDNKDNLCAPCRKLGIGFKVKQITQI